MLRLLLSASFLRFYFLPSLLGFTFLIIKSFSRSFFFLLQCRQNSVLVLMHLSTGKIKCLGEAVCRDKSRVNSNFFVERLLLEKKGKSE